MGETIYIMGSVIVTVYMLADSARTKKAPGEDSEICLCILMFAITWPIVGVLLLCGWLVLLCSCAKKGAQR